MNKARVAEAARGPIKLKSFDVLKIKRFYPEPCRRICVGFKGVGR